MSNLYDHYGHCLGHVNSFYYKMGEIGMNFELDNGKTFHFNPGDFLRDRQGDWRIRKPEESILDSLHHATWADRVMEEASKKKETATMTAASIKKVIFNPPATVVYWTDGSKTVVKCNAKDNFDPEKGLAMAIAKRCASNSPDFYKEMQEWVKKSGYKQPVADATKPDMETIDRLISQMHETIVEADKNLYTIEMLRAAVISELYK